MIKFDFKGIRIDATAETEQRNYKDADHRQKTRFERNVRVFVKFWDFTIWDGDLQELAFVKSTLQYFMQGYWKRTGKEGSKIELAKGLHHENPYEGRQSLYFVARQKNKTHFLQICLQKGGTTVNEVYLDGQEVLMLDVAIGKCINMLTPNLRNHEESIFG